MNEAGEAKTMSLAEAECPELAELEDQAAVQETVQEESRFEASQGLPMYQTDDQWLSWKHVERAGSGASAAEVSFRSRWHLMLWGLMKLTPVIRACAI